MEKEPYEKALGRLLDDHSTWTVEPVVYSADGETGTVQLAIRCECRKIISTTGMNLGEDEIYSIFGEHHEQLELRLMDDYYGDEDDDGFVLVDVD